MRQGTSHLLESQYLQSAKFFKSPSTSIARKFLFSFIKKKFINHKVTNRGVIMKELTQTIELNCKTHFLSSQLQFVVDCLSYIMIIILFV